MKSYCYSVRDSLNGNKLVGGNLHANDLNEAIHFAIKNCKLTQEVSGSSRFPRIQWVRNGRKVYLNMNINADHYLTEESKEAIKALNKISYNSHGICGDPACLND